MNKYGSLLTMCASLALVACGGGSSSSSSNPDGDELLSPVAPTIEPVSTEVLTAFNQAVDFVADTQTKLDGLLAQPQRAAFLARMSAGDDVLLVKQGDLSVHGVCVSSSESEAPSYKVEMHFRTSVDGALLSETFRRGSQYMSSDTTYVTVSESDLAEVDIDEITAVSVNGDVISLNGETTLFSVGAQGSDCLVAGMATVMKGSVAPEFVIPVDDEPGDILPPPGPLPEGPELLPPPPSLPTEA